MSKDDPIVLVVMKHLRFYVKHALKAIPLTKG